MIVRNDEGKQLFTEIIADYKKGIVSADDTDLYSLLLSGAEIGWYIRHEQDFAAETIKDYWPISQIQNNC